MTYLQGIAGSLGISVWLLVVIFVWSFVWKLLALWKSARKNHLIWFIVMGIANTMGILEILYIYVFSDMIKSKRKTQTKLKPARKKKK
jgi:predicted membrane protein